MTGIDHVRLLIKNNRAGEEIFRITPRRLKEAEARHREIASCLTTTIDWDVDHFEEHIGSAHGLVTWDLPTEALARRAPNLRWIHIIGAGVDHLQPLDWVPKGVSITNNRGIHADKAGEYGLMALLMLHHRIPQSMTAQRNHEYLEQFTSVISGSRLLVIGAGHMGQAVGAAAQNIGVETIGIRRRAQPTPGFEAVHGPDDLDALLPTADAVLITAPLTDETRHLIDTRRFGLMKPGAGLINMGRARIVDEPALIEALTSGHLSGAVLDVFEPEPVPEHSALWDTPNLVMTPHMSSDDAEWYTPKTLDLIFENVGRLQAGLPLRNVVDLEAGY